MIIQGFTKRYIIANYNNSLYSPLLELSNYHVLGRIFYYVPHLSPVPPGRVLSIFGALMALVETLNALGVALAANTKSSHSKQEMGGHLTVAALALQVCVIITFVALAGIFHWRCIKTSIKLRAVPTLLVTMYASMSLIFVRCIYRLVEHTGNTAVQLNDIESLKALSPILRYEWYFYVFEATLMLLNSYLWNIWNPGRYLPRNSHVYIARDGKTEISGASKSDQRSRWAVLGSMLTFGLLFRGRKKYESVEELVQLSTNQDGSNGILYK